MLLRFKALAKSQKKINQNIRSEWIIQSWKESMDFIIQTHFLGFRKECCFDDAHLLLFPPN